MKAAVLYQTNEPIVVEDGIQIPELQSGQVLVKVAYAGLCQSQLMEARGKRGEDRFLPHLMGHEASGTVQETGNGVSKINKGDKVVLTWIKGKGADCPGAEYRKGDIKINSGGVTTFNEYTVVSENRCVRLPEGVPMDLAPLLGCALPTGVGIVLNTLRPKQGSALAVFGMGGVGLSAVMAAKIESCRQIFAVDIEDHKLQLAQEIGATHLINSRYEDPVSRIYETTGGRGLDFAIEASGKAKVVESAFNSVRDGGGLCVIAGHPDPQEKFQMKPHDLIRGKRIQGSWGGECQPDRDIPRLAQFYLDGQLPLEKLISHRYKLENINQALNDLERRIATRVLIEVHPTSC